MWFFNRLLATGEVSQMGCIGVGRFWLMVVLVLTAGMASSQGQEKTPQQQLADVESQIVHAQSGADR